MKNNIKFFFNKKHKKIDQESVFLKYKKILEEEIKKAFFKKYNYEIPNFDLNFNKVNFTEEGNIFNTIKKDIINLDFIFRPPEKTLFFTIDNEDTFDEDYITKVTIKFLIK